MNLPELGSPVLDTPGIVEDLAHGAEKFGIVDLTFAQVRDSEKVRVATKEVGFEMARKSIMTFQNVNDACHLGARGRAAWNETIGMFCHV